MTRAKKTGIKRIRVARLFGLYDYEIPLSTESKNIERVLILYGDNGSGKTTILRLIFHLLACERGEGHKTFVARTKFKEFVLDLSNGHTLVAVREEPRLLGSFRMVLYKDQEAIASTDYLADADNTVSAGGPNDEDNDQFLETLKELDLTLYLLADDRTVNVTSPTLSQMRMFRRRRHDEEEVHAEHYYYSFGVRAGERLDPEQISIMLLEESINRLRGWIRNRVMRGASQGESDVNVIFADIIGEIARKSRSEPPKKAIRREHIVERIRNIEQRNRQFSRFGLTPPFRRDKLLTAIDVASPEKFRSIRPIVIPYLDSIEAKLNALAEIQDVVERFVTTINSFLIDKTVSFHVRRGFKIESRGKERLSPNMLSSGERHLLLLFFNALTALDQQSIFIIDEPEISLNIKWQRNLITSLIECSMKGRVQYVFASHSMQILSQHMDKVVKLDQE